MRRRTSPSFRSWATAMAFMFLYFAVVICATLSNARELYILAGIYLVGFIVCMIAAKWQDKRHLKDMLRTLKLESDLHAFLKLFQEYKEAGPIPAVEWFAILELEYGWTREYTERLAQICLDNGWIKAGPL